ncbi:hypothetical protein [Paraglaciecola polaris]|uniref:Toprim domain-containing protein n=1 Tax=Paraglaciecola polaris LMG 21857 TaxID=1129793 RepID=K7AJU7_9ALTE|nr:hypothetical protein [Paraglaciecola polaris]GAC35645.1 hypothetical protein GPLA_4771 [Paraglaciecola polaris LMG 21857]
MQSKNNNEMSIADINQALVSKGIETVVSHLIRDTYKFSGDYITMGSINGGSGDSFVVDVKGKHSGMWFENNPEQAPNGQTKGDLVDLWMLTRNISKGDAIKEIKQFLNITNEQLAAQFKPNLHVVKPNKTVNHISSRQRLAQHTDQLKRVSSSTIKKYQSRLNNNEAALNYLYGRGLINETIEHFSLGLSTDYKSTDGILRSNALVFPIVRQDGEQASPYVYYSIPDVTQNAIDENGWCKSSPRLTYNMKRLDSHEYLIVVEGIKDLWACHQLIANSDLKNRIHICSSTHGSVIPVEIDSDPTVLAGYKRIFLAHDVDPAGDEIAMGWLKYVGTRGFRLNPPFEYRKKGDDKDWTDYLKKGSSAKDFLSLIESATPMRLPSIKTATNIKDLKPGVHGYDPVDISGSFTNGYLYYPVMVMESGVNVSDGVAGYSRVVKVLRSDRQLFDYRALPRLSRPGAIATPVYALNDGTLIADIPKTPPNASWGWNDIERWLDGNYPVRPLKIVVEDIEQLIASQIWLPNQDDYLILALVVVVTYVQNVFDAVPFVLATGAAGTGKSQLGEVMAKVAANGTVVGDTSAATIARILDETRGFLMLDDVEKLKNRVDGSNLQMDDFLQILKVSYKKSTAIKTVTETKTMTVKRLNFYGVKFMTNIQGIEAVLGTRTITVHTRKAPVGEFEQTDIDFEKIDALKPELHAWAMDNCESLHQCYKKYPTPNRSQEITAPLRAIIDMSGATHWHDVIDDLIDRMSIEEKAEMSPESVVKESVWRIAARGFNSIAIEQVIMEMSTLVPENYMKERTTDIPQWRQPEWVRKQLLNAGYINTVSDKRFRAYGKCRVMRLYKLTSHLFSDLPKSKKIVTKLEKISGVLFCKKFETCKECPYADVSCEIRDSTTKRRY